MCGIAGVIARDNRLVTACSVLPMLAVQAHRGPDGAGLALFSDDGGPPQLIYDTVSTRLDGQAPWRCVLGHRRLAILDLELTGRQPLTAGSGRYWITYNGELYNYLELRQRLAGLGYRFHTRTDTEVLLAAYDCWGTACLQQCNGMFAFAIYDRREARLFCARDRFGIKPLHYTVGDGYLYFASEIRALFAAGIIAKRADETSLIDYAAYNLIVYPHGRTFYDGIFSLPPGHYLEYTSDGLHIAPWYHLQAAAELPWEIFVQQVGELIRDAVHLELRSDMPVGTCLSGGLDSTTIAATIGTLLRAEAGSTGSFRAFHLKHADADTDESYLAHLTAEQSGLQLTLLEAPQQFELHDIIDFATTDDEPIYFFGNINQYLLYRLVHQYRIPVLLDGQGGDEVFIGYEWFYPHVMLSSLKRGDIVRLLGWLLRGTRHLNAPWSTIGRWARRIRSPNAWSKAFAAGLIDTFRHGPPNPRESEALGQLTGWTDWAARQAIAFYGPYELATLLRDADRQGMRWSIEGRFPLLDHRLVELVRGQNPLRLVHDGWSKYALRSATAGLIPDAVRFNPVKRGFYTNQNAKFPAMQDCARTLARHSKTLQTYFDTDRLDTYLQRSNHGAWRIFNIGVVDLVDPDRRNLPDILQLLRREAPSARWFTPETLAASGRGTS